MQKGFGILFGLVLLSPATGFGQLAFESKLVESSADPAAETLEVKFPYTNEQKTAVEITKIDTSCGCLKAESDKSVLAPGETGTVTGVFSLGVRSGTYEKSLTVKTASDAGNMDQELRVRVTVPELMELAPKQLMWDVGEELTPKSYILEIKRDEPIRVTSVNTSRPGFDCTVHEIEEGKKYRLELTPASTIEPVMGIIRVETDCEIQKHRRQLAFFSVKRANPPQAAAR